MNLYRLNLREARDLRLTVAIGIALLVYVVSINTVGPVRRALSPWTDLPLAQLLAHAACIWLCVLLLVAYRRWREVAIREQELDDIIFSLNPVALIVVDAEDRVRMCNSAVRTVFGYEPSDVVGRSTDTLYGDAQAVGGDLVRAQLEGTGFLLAQASARPRRGEPFPVEVFACRLQGKRGAVILVRDIRDRVAAEEALKRAKGELEHNYNRLQELERLRDDLVHMIVHDMKSPLQSVVGYLQLLQIRGGAVDAERSDTARFLDRALREATRLSGLVESTLDVSRLEAGEMPLKRRTVNLYDVCGRALDSVSGLLGNRRLRCGDGDAPAECNCDPEIVERVLINLLSNAIRYSPDEGEIRLRVESGDGVLRVSVSDQGEGIPLDDRERIFEKFGTARNGNGEAKRSSTGLGLTFCKLAIEAHGGRIGVDSRPGEGSTFWFEIPAVGVSRPVGVGEEAVPAEA
jgi:PAS domain S-box-containing protein